MKASELIAELQKSIAAHGDVAVCYEVDDHTIPCVIPRYQDSACLYDFDTFAKVEAVPRLMVSWGH